jgi:hypothetical protein
MASPTPRLHGPPREAAVLQVRDHGGAGGRHDLASGIAGGVHQREHRKYMLDERTGGEQNSYGRPIDPFLGSADIGSDYHFQER